MKKRHITQVRGKGTRSDGGRETTAYDTETGEVLDGAFMFVPQKKRSPFGLRWFAMGQEAMMFLAENSKVLGEEGFKVLMALGSKIDMENFILISQAEFAREIGLRPQNLNRAMKKLEALGIIERGPKSGRSPTFRMNPHMAWKGSAKNHFSALQQAQSRGWDLVDGGKDLEPDPNQMDLPFQL